VPAIRRSLASVVIALLLGIAAPLPLNVQRLGDAVVQQHYSLRFSPDLQREQFDGDARIRVTIREPTSRFVLHAAPLGHRRDGRRRRDAATVSTAAAAQTITLDVGTPITPGQRGAAIGVPRAV
jgi:hypothetical protein